MSRIITPAEVALPNIYEITTLMENPIDYHIMADASIRFSMISYSRNSPNNHIKLIGYNICEIHLRSDKGAACNIYLYKYEDSLWGIVTFKGSTLHSEKTVLSDWRHNLQLHSTDFTPHDKSDSVYIHSGFSAYFTSLLQLIKSESVQDNIFGLKNANLWDILSSRCSQVLCTGHSLGGAMAIQMAIKLGMCRRSPVLLVTFGTPVVGNNDFAELQNKHAIPLGGLRLYNKGDIVTFQPKAFSHGGMEIQLNPYSKSPYSNHLSFNISQLCIKECNHIIYIFQGIYSKQQITPIVSPNLIETYDSFMNKMKQCKIEFPANHHENRSVTWTSNDGKKLTIPAVYIITIPSAIKRQKKLIDRYDKLFGGIERCFWYGATSKQYKLQNGDFNMDMIKTMSNLGLIDPKYIHIANPNAVSLLLNRAAAYMSMLKSKHKFALFLEDDFILIKMKEDYVYDCNGKYVSWNDITSIEDSINKYDACSCDTEDTCMKFQNDFVNTYYNVPKDWNCIYGGNIMGTVYKQIAEGVAKTKCALATHGYICNQEYVKAIIPRIYPFLMNEDAIMADYHHKINYDGIYSFEPNLISQDLFFEVYGKAKSGSSIGYSKSQRFALKYSHKLRILKYASKMGFCGHHVAPYHNANLLTLLDPLKRQICGRIETNIDKKFSSQLQKTKPLNIWMWWEGDMSPTVNCCINSWKYWFTKIGIKFDIIIVNTKNIHEFIYEHRYNTCLQNKTKLKALQSDFARLALIEKNGGLYMDATVYIRSDMSWLFESPFQAYYSSFNSKSCKFPSVETPFLYSANCDHPLITDWLNELMKIEDCSTMDSVRDYLNKNKSIYIGRFLFKEYHIAYHCITNVLMQKLNGIFDYNGVILHETYEHDFWILDLEEFSKNPKHIINFVKGDVANTIRNSKGPVVKISHTERNRLDKQLNNNVLCEDLK